MSIQGFSCCVHIVALRDRIGPQEGVKALLGNMNVQEHSLKIFSQEQQGYTRKDFKF